MLQMNALNPITGTQIDSVGEITITIEIQGQSLHLHYSYFLIEGNVLKADVTRYADADFVALTNNGLLYLFSSGVNIGWTDGGTCQLSWSGYITSWYSELFINILQRLWTSSRLVSRYQQ